MKVLAVVLALCAVAESLTLDHFFPYEDAYRLQNGDDITRDQFRLSEAVVFYDSVFNGLSVNTDGFITLGIVDREEEEVAEAIIAPFRFDLDGSNGEIYFQELVDEISLARATEDVKRAFEETASTFTAKSVYLTTWVEMQSAEHPGVNFTFQCAVSTNGLSSYAIFLYPENELTEEEREILVELTVRVGFSDQGGDQLEVLSALDLLEGGNTGEPGEWIFQIGGILLSLDEDEETPLHHIKAEPIHYRRQAEFEVSEVNFNEDLAGPFGETCETLECDATNSNCVPFTDGYCCECMDGYFGNGVGCVKSGEAVRYNGAGDGYVIVMNSDNTWTNETAPSLDIHAYADARDGRVFSVLTGEISAKFSKAIQPMSIFGTTLGWVFAQAASPAINGFQFTGGKITSDTYIRYSTGPYEFRIHQEYDELTHDPEGDVPVLGGKMTFSGRLPVVEDGGVTFEPYTQLYTKTGPGTIRSRDTRSYKTTTTPHEYSIDQRITFDSCESAFEQVPQDLLVDVNDVFIEYFENEGSLRYAMSNAIRSGEIGVRPTEPTTQPPTPPSREPPVVPTDPPVTLTLCEKQLEEARKIQEAAPHSTEQLFFPTCTELGTFTPRQCKAYDAVCWCVDQNSGVEVEGTRTLPQEGYDLDCSDVEPPEADRTPCQDDRDRAEKARIAAGGEARASSIFMPRCMESGAYEPVQQLPDGSFMCVGFDGQELSRSTSEPTCLTPCQLEAYIALSSNVFRSAGLFVVDCSADGGYVPKQCVASYCYCVDRNGLEIPNSRVETTFSDDVDVNCHQFQPTIATTTTTVRTTTTTRAPAPPRDQAGRLIFAQSMGINSIRLPVTRDNSVSRRLFASSDQIAISLAYDCAKRTYYWGDVSKRRIYSSEIDGDGSRKVVLSDGIRSPEGIAVDFLNGNIYWTDSDSDRIEVSKSDGSNRMTLVSGDMVNPRGIAVDPIRGRMYWTDWNRAAPKIWIADMNGENKKVLVSEGLGLPNDITIDFYNQRVCFVDAGTHKVECMSLDGQGRQTVYQMKQVPRPHPFGLAIDGDVLYYSSWGASKVVHAVNWRTGDHIPIASPRGAHGQNYGVALVPSQCPRGNNYCAYDNGGCSHLCLPKPNGRDCKCPPGAADCEEA